jgi:hypothetical protein
MTMNTLQISSYQYGTVSTSQAVGVNNNMNFDVLTAIQVGSSTNPFSSILISIDAPWSF